MDKNKQLCERVEILQSNQAKLKNLLEVTETDHPLARQHITALQAGHNAKKDKQKCSSNKAEWLTSKANEKKRTEEKAECAKREAEEKLITGKKKDDLKDIAQALCLDLQGKNQELSARTKKKSAQKKRKEPTPVASGGGRDGEDVDAVPPLQRPRLH